jgi:hypothetical protein
MALARSYSSGSYHWSEFMKKLIMKGSVLVALISFASACVVDTPREGYWDHEHNRYWADRAWHDCVTEDIHCR